MERSKCRVARDALQPEKPGTGQLKVQILPVSSTVRVGLIWQGSVTETGQYPCAQYRPVHPSLLFHDVNSVPIRRRGLFAQVLAPMKHDKRRVDIHAWHFPRAVRLD